MFPILNILIFSFSRQWILYEEKRKESEQEHVGKRPQGLKEGKNAKEKRKRYAPGANVETKL